MAVRRIVVSLGMENALAYLQLLGWLCALVLAATIGWKAGVWTWDYLKERFLRFLHH